jgi:hypothetical protein
MSFPDPSFPDASSNPYAAPSGAIGPEALEPWDDVQDAESIRRRYGRHEASIRAMGLLSIMGAIILGVAAVFLVVLASRGADFPRAPQGPPPEFLRAGLGVFAVLFLGLSALGFALGTGLRRLQTWARWTQTTLLILGIGFTALGMLINLVAAGRQDVQAPVRLISSVPSLLVNIYFLSLLLSSQSVVIFSPSYRAAVARTPGLRFSPTIVMQILVGLVVFMFVLFGVGLGIGLFITLKR